MTWRPEGWHIPYMLNDKNYWGELGELSGAYEAGADAMVKVLITKIDSMLRPLDRPSFYLFLSEFNELKKQVEG